MDEFDPELKNLIEACSLERELNPAETDEDRSKRILTEAGPIAAMSVVQLARQAANEALRFRASTYILDRVLGPLGKTDGLKPPWEDVFSSVVVPDDASSLEK